jgi:hypothetical protein
VAKEGPYLSSLENSPMTLTEAHKLLGDIIPPNVAYVIRLDSWRYSGSGGPRPISSPEWSVCVVCDKDDCERYEGATLAGVVEKVLKVAAQRWSHEPEPKPAGTTEAEESIREVA